jgi:methionyl-tRNA formyltransferase
MKNNTGEKLNFVFFGGEPLSVPALEKLYKNGMAPKVIICNPDKPAGRNLEITPPPTKTWAIEHNVPVLQPEKLDESFIKELKSFGCDFGVVVSYGKIIPKEIVNFTKLGLINMHPSLLPIYRGPAPIVAPILNGDNETGVTIIKIDEEMDHGPILAQEKINLNGSEFIQDLEKTLANLGGDLLARTLPQYAAGNIEIKKQDHSQATYVKKMIKANGEIDLRDDALKNWRKFRAYHTWPRTFFFKDGKRIIITKAKLEDGKFVIERVIPEGGKEIDYKN